MVILLGHYFENNENLKSELRIIKYDYSEYSFMFYSDNGVFSKDKIDYASRLLLETYLQKRGSMVPSRILDVGCGYGFLGIVLSKILGASVLMSDVNKRAIHLTKRNIEENNVNGEVILSNAYEDILGKYPLIITNPPIRAGNKVLFDILMSAYEYLEDDGELWFVIHKDQGAKSTIEKLKKLYEIEVMEKNKGFFVIKANKTLT